MVVAQCRPRRQGHLHTDAAVADYLAGVLSGATCNGDVKATSGSVAPTESCFAGTASNAVTSTTPGARRRGGCRGAHAAGSGAERPDCVLGQ